MKIEVTKAYKRRIAREKKKQERIDLSPAARCQPNDRHIRYDNVKSAMAEEDVVAMLLREPALLDACGQLLPEDFSSQLLGRVFEQLVQGGQRGADISLAALTDFTPEEMSHIARIVQQYNGTVSEQALSDCIRTIRTERQIQTVKSTQNNDELLSYQQQLLARKGLKK